jgi:hypothetical protein
MEEIYETLQYLYLRIGMLALMSIDGWIHRQIVIET